MSVGVIPTVTALDVPLALERFHHAHPEVGIALQVSGSDALELAIGRGEVDVGLLGLPKGREPRGVAWRLLVTDRHVVLVSEDHPLASRRQVQLRDLAGEVFADFPAGGPGRTQSDLAFRAAEVHRNVAFEVLGTDLMIDLVRRNLAITLLPSRYAPTSPGLVAVPLKDGPSRGEYLAWSGFNPSPASRAFLALLEDSS